MSLTLGEKLRQAREERGISISEVAEQTRISSMYLEMIENDDYRTLPGGIFNKGFVKSYAKYVGLDEQEALQDYARLVSASEESSSEDSKTYRPEVLTDDRTSGSIIPTIIFAVIILGLMTWGILALVNYIQENQNRPPVANNNPGTNSNANSNMSNTAQQPPAGDAPTMENAKVEFKAVGDEVALTVISDGKSTSGSIKKDTSASYTAKESLKFSYSKYRVAFAQLTINGKQITLPQTPSVPKASTISFEITSANLAQIWQAGAINFGADVSPTDANTNTAPVTPPASTTPRATPPKPAATPRPAASPAATPAKATPTPARPTNTPRPRSSP